MMNALVQTAVKELEFKQVPRPKRTQTHEVVRILASGICGSDMHAFLGHDPRRPAPLTLGHEAAGVVVEGPDAGRRVVINPLVTCGKCEDCAKGRTNLCVHRQIISMPPREGAFAEYVAIPHENLVSVPNDVPFTKAALTEPLACGWHAARLCHVTIDRPLGDLRCVVLGGGAIGVGAALALAAVGAEDITVIEPNAQRRNRLQKAPQFRIFDTNDPRLPAPGSAHLVIDGVGFAATRAHACEFARPGGVIAHIGLAEASDGLDIRRMTLQEIQFIGCYTYTRGDFKATAQAIFQGRLGALDWVDTRPLSDGQAAFEDILAGKAPAPKVMLIP